MKLPPQQYNLLLRGDSIHECPSCQRIVYYRPPENT
jgi:predicted  nucleic acid-binding Zn-ribbon protein